MKRWGRVLVAVWVYLVIWRLAVRLPDLPMVAIWLAATAGLIWYLVGRVWGEGAPPTEANRPPAWMAPADPTAARDDPAGPRDR